jgi:hypothetical protein
VRLEAQPGEGFVEQLRDRHDVVGRGSRRAVLLDEAVVEHDAVVGGEDFIGDVFPRTALPPFFADGRREVGWVLAEADLAAADGDVPEVAVGPVAGLGLRYCRSPRKLVASKVAAPPVR